MKKILLSFLMLCTAMSAWSYETKTATISCNGTNTSPFTVDATTASDGRDADPYWQVDDYNTLVLKAPTSYYVTKVDFTTMSGKVDYCDKFTKYQLNVWVSPNKEVLQYYDVITFSNPEGSIAKVTSISVTYHRCEGTYYAASPSTCNTPGTAEYWECDCGRIYSDADCTHETDMASLVIAATNHKDCMTFVSEVPATCDTKGKQSHWHCSACGGNFSDKEGTTAIADVTIPAINHKNKTFNEAVAPTTETTGSVAYWHCPDCGKNFEDKGCTKEITGTDYELEKLVNMMHLDFAGTSTPIETEHYMNTTKFNFTAAGNIILTVNDKSVTYGKGMIGKVQFSNGTPTAQISANEDPENTGTYYSTFYSSLESYAVPEGFTAYRGEISDDGTKLSLTSVKDDVMTRGEGYILKGTASSGSMEVTANAGGSTDNVLLGTDVAIAELPDNSYALSLGQHGVGFYLWDGKEIGANKAYLIWDGSKTSAKAFTFQFEDETDAIHSINVNDSSTGSETGDNMYNLNGVRVNNGYKGIVIVNGKKVIK